MLLHLIATLWFLTILLGALLLLWGMIDQDLPKIRARLRFEKIA